jgi:hypothetical protein
VIKFWAATEIEPPDLIVLLHIVIDTAKDPDATVPNPAGVIVTRDEFPCSRPSPCLQIKVTDIVQYTVMSSLTAADV